MSNLVNTMSFFNFFRSIDDKPVSIVLVGDGSTGKSSLYSRLTTDQTQYKFKKEYIATQGFNLGEIDYKTNRGDIKVHLWDTAGQEKFGSLRQAYVHGADICVIMYDLTNPKTKSNIDYWLTYLKESCKNPPIVIIAGNKSDKLKDIDLCTRTSRLKKQFNYPNEIRQIEISVKNNSNVLDIIESGMTLHYGMQISLKD